MPSVHEILMMMTARLPMRPIPVNGKDYLERYFIGQEPSGAQIWLHRFLAPDPDRFYHSHPWRAVSTMLCGGYTEMRLVDGAARQASVRAGHVNDIGFDTFHKITHVEPNTWTLLVVEPNWSGRWFFINDDGKRVETVMKSHGDHKVPWWVRYGPRPTNNGAGWGICR